ncbi:MAG: RNA 2',3'-cyclic phosphodiesterase [Thaumarchaeota archaeon]|nr:RNA 2',3'-cyclic phosphodiesterase [Nitrososphaerota archaeon]
MRAFIAMDIDNPETLAAIQKFQEQIKQTGGDVKIVDTQNMHFTLLFLGEVSEEETLSLKERLFAVKQQAFEGELVGTGVFPNPNRVTVVWVGVDGNVANNLKVIADNIVKALSGSRFKPDKPFEPHLTVARIKSGKAREKILDVVSSNSSMRFGGQQLKEFKLKKSELTSAGPIYTDLYSFKLG